MPQTVGSTGSAFAVKTKLLFLKGSFEKIARTLRKSQVSGFGRSPSFAE